MGAPELRYLTSWGKADEGARRAHVAHPLAYHCLDVAATAQMLLQERPDWQRTFGRQTPFPATDLLQIIGFVSALHDLGKFSDTFQAKVPTAVEALGGTVGSSLGRTPHGAMGHLMFERVIGPSLARLWFPDRVNDSTPNPKAMRVLRPIRPWLTAAFGHHGSPPTTFAGAAGTTPVLSNECSAGLLQDAEQFCLDLTRLFDLSSLVEWLQSAPPAEQVLGVKRCGWMVAGLVIAADWMGSEQAAFEFTPGTFDLDTYWKEFAMPRAAAWVARVAAAYEPALGGAILDPAWTPSPLQSAALDDDLAEGPQFHLIEDQTGSGKTEAALVLSQRLIATGAGNGLYFALPTGTTSTAMHSRLLAHVPALYAGQVPVSLLHGRVPAEDAVAMVHTSLGTPSAETAASEEAGAWLRDHRKARLLSPIAVGTVDQAMLAVLTSRHNALRILGLAGKVLVVDEVHGYDPYMVHIIETLLRLHLRHGGSAIFLSATLPRRVQERFVNAAREELSIAAGDGPATSYPAWTSVDTTGYRSAALASTGGDDTRRVTVRTLESYSDVLAEVLRAQRAGLCVAWIRNTVQDTLDAADSLLAAGCPTTVAHSRMMDGDRQAVDELLLQRFGPRSTALGRAGQVVVSTQVIEQSLDLDFDLMVSDLAPVELLIQRCGRLWRHERANRPAVDGSTAAARLFVFVPSRTDNGTGWLEGPWRPTGIIYQDHGILWRTAELARARPQWVFPRDARGLISAVHDSEAAPDGLERNRADVFGRTLAQEHHAALNTVDLDEVYQSELDLWPEETWAPTRLGEPAFDVYLARLQPGEAPTPLHEDGWMASRVSLRKKWRPVAQSPPTAAAEILPPDARRLLPSSGRFAHVLTFGPQREDGSSKCALAELQYKPGLGLISTEERR